MQVLSKISNVSEWAIWKFSDIHKKKQGSNVEILSVHIISVNLDICFEFQNISGTFISNNEPQLLNNKQK